MMNARRVLPLVITLSTILSAAGPSPAMEILQFERLAEFDQHAYVGDLAWGAVRILEEDCKPEIAAQVRKLFFNELNSTNTDITDAATLREGTLSFGRKLMQMSERAARSPEAASRIRVESALLATLRENGIALPERFASIDSAFKPKVPPADEFGDDDFGLRRFDAAEPGADVEYLVGVKILQDGLDERHIAEASRGIRPANACQGAAPRATPSPRPQR